jgi:hypothetical protein
VCPAAPDDNTLATCDGISCGVDCKPGFAMTRRFQCGPAWEDRGPTVISARSRGALAFDPIRARVVLAGGFELGTARWREDLWEWDGQAWQDRTSAQAWGPKDPLLVSAPDRASLVLMGGFLQDQSRAWGREFYEWNGALTPLLSLSMSTEPVPAPRQGFAAAYQASSQSVFVFGGSNSGCVNNVCGGELTDTWALRVADGAWRRAGTGGPGSCQAPTMAFDTARDELLLVCGTRTYRWAEPNWTLVDATGPDLKAVFSVPSRGAVMAIDVALEQLNEWVDGGWVERAFFSQPPPTEPLSATDTRHLTFDAQRSSLVMFGATPDGGTRTWAVRVEP